MDIRLPIPSTLREDILLRAFHASLETSDDGFLFVDTEGRIAYINDAYCHYLDVRREEILGKPVLDCIDTSKMGEAASDPNFETEVGVLHKVSAKQYRDGEHYCIVNRANVSRDGVPIAGVGQVKFVRNTLQLSSAINSVYDELTYYKDELRRLSATRYSFKAILGDSPPMEEVKKLAKQAARNDFPVLITGETGTGKEVFSSAIHYASDRKCKPFIRINCASIPTELLESELFGYTDGAFTGARKGGKKGKFEIANGGTLFLDEIGDMPLPMQAKILRVLQEREVELIGGEKPVPVDVRIIAATNQNLNQEIAAKRFRADLFYRLNVINILLPPLRQHLQDVTICAEAFLRSLNEQYHTDVLITPDAIRDLARYNWPGNVRELKNVVERCYVLQEHRAITSRIVSRCLSVLHPQISSELIAGKPLDAMMDEYEREILLSAVQANHSNLRQTAMALGIHRVTLYKKLEKYGLTRADFTKNV